MGRHRHTGRTNEIAHLCGIFANCKSEPTLYVPNMVSSFFIMAVMAWFVRGTKASSDCLSESKRLGETDSLFTKNFVSIMTPINPLMHEKGCSYDSSAQLERCTLDHSDYTDEAAQVEKFCHEDGGVFYTFNATREGSLSVVNRERISTIIDFPTCLGLCTENEIYDYLSDLIPEQPLTSLSLSEPSQKEETTNAPTSSGPTRTAFIMMNVVLLFISTLSIGMVVL